MSRGEESRVVFTPLDSVPSKTFPLQDAKVAAIHPSGSKLVVADNPNRLSIVDVSTGQVERTCWVGGRKDSGAIEREMMDQYQQAWARVDYDELEQQMRKRQEAMLHRLTSKQLPPGINSIEEFKEDLDRQMTLQIQRMREEFPKIGTPEWEADRVSGAERVFDLIFDASGERLFLATSGGARVYRWNDIVGASEYLTRPVLSSDARLLMTEAEQDLFHRRDDICWTLAYDPVRKWLLFGGLDGRVRYLDVQGGRSGVLFEPPVPCAIARLCLSIDRSALGLTGRVHWHSDPRNMPGPVVQFWDYPALCRRI